MKDYQALALARRAYAADLAKHAECYRVAAAAPGLRKDAARYLESEADRLESESRLNADYAEEIAAKGRTAAVERRECAHCYAPMPPYSRADQCPSCGARA